MERNNFDFNLHMYIDLLYTFFMCLTLPSMHNIYIKLQDIHMSIYNTVTLGLYHFQS